MTLEKNNTEKQNNRVGLIILAILVGVYIIGTIIFSYIALPGTYLNGKEISFASKKQALASAPDDFGLMVKGIDDRKLNIRAGDIDYKAELPRDAKIDQNPFLWPKALISKQKQDYDFEYKIHYSEDKLDKLIDNSELTNGITKPENAKIVVKDKELQIQKEVEGNEVKRDKLKKAIIDGINTKNSEINLDKSFYKHPEIRSDSEKLNAILEDAKHLKEMKISFNFNGFDLKLEGDNLYDLFDVDESGFNLNYDRVHEYVKYLAEQTDTYGKNRKFNATGIGEIVVNPGVYGFKLNIDGMIDKIYEQVNSRKSGDIEPVYTNIAFTRTENGTDIGDTYVEVDISRQHMWFYKNGNLIMETDLVSGRNVDQWQSNVGVGQILGKEANAKLKGVNFDGQTEYETPVDYWMPIGWDGEGFHDAPWRGAFGGQIYLSNGSHGCFNLPPSAAKTLFENVDFVTPVVVYESSTNLSPPMVY